MKLRGKSLGYLHRIILEAVREKERLAFNEGFKRGSKRAEEKTYIKGYEQGKFDQRMETAFNDVAKITNSFGINVGETAQEKRDRIVERAKADIENIIGRHDSFTTTLGGYTDQAATVRFVVNKEKRTIVALIFGYYTKRLYAKGIAKCAPTDCFNSAIGKAIALRRALGLEITSEYLNAPQPTEVRVGDVVESGITGRIYTLGYNFKIDTYKRNDHLFEIIDDSRDEVVE